MKVPIAKLESVLVSALFLVAASVYSQESSVQSRPLDVTQERLQSLGQRPDNGPVIMVNLLKFKPDGGQAAYMRYGTTAMQQIRKRGGEVLYRGQVADLQGRDAEWDVVAIVKYPSRAAFLDMLQDPEYQKGVPHRTEGLDKTLVHAFRPMEGMTRLDEDGDVPKVEAAGPDAYFILNLLRFKGEEGRQSYERYGQNTVGHIEKRGGAVVLRLMGEQPMVGEEVWDTLALVMYPSREAFLDMMQDPEYRKGLAHRSAGLDGTIFLPTKMAQGGAQ